MCISFAHVGEPAYRWMLYNSYVDIHERSFNYAMYMSVSWDIVECNFSLRAQRVCEPISFLFFYSTSLVISLSVRLFAVPNFRMTELNWTKQRSETNNYFDTFHLEKKVKCSCSIWLDGWNAQSKKKKKI